MPYNREYYLKKSAGIVKNRMNGRSKQSYYVKVEIPEQECRSCKKLYTPKKRNSLYCSSTCCKKWHNNSLAFKEDKQCESCSTITKKRFCDKCAYDRKKEYVNNHNWFKTLDPEITSGIGSNENHTDGLMSRQECIDWIKKVRDRRGMVSFEELFIELITVFFSIGGKVETNVGKPAKQLMRMWKICGVWYDRAVK